MQVLGARTKAHLAPLVVATREYADSVRGESNKLQAEAEIDALCAALAVDKEMKEEGEEEKKEEDGEEENGEEDGEEKKEEENGEEDGEEKKEEEDGKEKKEEEEDGKEKKEEEEEKEKEEEEEEKEKEEEEVPVNLMELPIMMYSGDKLRTLTKLLKSLEGQMVFVGEKFVGVLERLWDHLLPAMADIARAPYPVGGLTDEGRQHIYSILALCKMVAKNVSDAQDSKDCLENYAMIESWLELFVVQDKYMRLGADTKARMAADTNDTIMKQVRHRLATVEGASVKVIFSAYGLRLYP